VHDPYDFAVIGAGFFGVRLALLLARRDASVALIDREPRILARASWANQARIHNGYHYPRSLSTAAGSHRHYERFLREMAGCVDESFTHVYAVARDGSATSAAQLERFCRELGLPLTAAPRSARRLLDASRIEAAFAVREGAFNALALRTQLEARLAATPAVTLLAGHGARRIDLAGSTATVLTDAGPVRARAVFLVAYAGINELLRASGLQPLDLKAELAEICLVDVPPELRGFAFTVIDGPFFSLMPMPALGTSSLTHVRYTPQASWSLLDDPRPPYALARSLARPSRFLFMQRDAQRFLPAAASLARRGSLFELKAIPNRHEIDDGRPILVRCHAQAPLCVSVLGSKIDSVFELEEAVGDLLDGRVPAARG
jgi:glycine/D-amino acid oxidase-like deaminating enzyme